MKLAKTLAAALAALGLAAAANGAPVDSGHARAELLSAVDTAVPGQQVDLALRLELDRGWHTYWENPGDSGLPARISWTLPAGVTAGPIEWPVPQRIPTPPFMTYGYEDEVTLPLRVALDPDLASGGSLTLNAHAQYLVCREVCLPEQARLELTLALGESTRPDPAAQAAIAQARGRLPRPAPPELAVSAGRHGDALYLEWDGALQRSAYFYAAEPQRLEHPAEQSLMHTAGGQALQLTPSSLADGPVERLRGVLAAEPGFGPERALSAVRVDLPVAALAAPPATTEPAPAHFGLALALALAFAGGVILNLMPCVFPVLALKVTGLAGAAGGRARAVGLAYAGGVLASVWVLAAVLLALRAGGHAIGWGFQLQNAPFVAALALLMTAVGVNLLGAFEVGAGLAARAGELDRRGGLGGAALAGVLAVLLATPCTAPFMAAALGYALAQPPAHALAVFTALALGLAAPFLALAELPGLAARLPRPGPWMLRLRQGLAFPMLAAALWLSWVYGRERGHDAGVLLIGAMLVLAFALWAVGLLQRRGTWPARVSAVAGALATAALLAAALRLPAAASDASAAGALAWQPWSEAAVAEHRAAGRPVFVDFTADWCLTCKVNERVALGSARVVRAFAARGVVALKADWTRHNPAITRALAGFGRSGVPLYLYYPPGGEGRVLPELLTPGVVLSALEAS